MREAAGQNSSVIRRAGPADASAILRCLQIAFEPYRSRYTAAGFEDTVLSAESLKQRLAVMCIFVTDAGGDVVGTIACQALSGEEGHLRGMAVLPEWQGHGVAAQLLAAAEAHLAAQGCSRVTLDTTEPLHRATRFYVKHGYHASSQVTDFFGMPLHEYVKDLHR